MPFMEYAGSYALYNYKLADPSKGMDYDNIRLIRAFEHGLDHTSSEAGFVLVHIDMVQNSGPLVSGTVEALQAAHVVQKVVVQVQHTHVGNQTRELRGQRRQPTCSELQVMQVVARLRDEPDLQRIPCA